MSKKRTRELNSRYRKAFRDRDPERYRVQLLRAALRRLYGITLEQYEQMLAEQSGRCAICGNFPPPSKRSNRLSVDHDHNTGEIRGLLCHRCNIAISGFEHQPELVFSAYAYLNRHRSKPIKAKPQLPARQSHQLNLLDIDGTKI